MRYPDGFGILQKGETLTNQGSAQERPDYGAASGQGETQMGPIPGFPVQGAGYPGQGAGQPGQAPGYQGYPGGWTPQQAQATAKGFFASLFDISFTSFVTPKIIKVVYLLLMILGGLGALFFILSSLIAGQVLYILFALIAGVLLFFIELALWRIGLEIIMVIFRMSDDIKAIREQR